MRKPWAQFWWCHFDVNSRLSLDPPDCGIVVYGQGMGWPSECEWIVPNTITE